MWLTPRRNATGILVAAVGWIAACGIGGDSRDIPPAPTAAPGGSDVYVYVAEATDETQGTSGGAISVYQLGDDGLLPAAPNASVDAVNPRRLVEHPDPEIDVLYVATLNQILAFDISTGGLDLLPGCTGRLAPPCATSARQGSDPIDLVVEANPLGTGYVLYVVERGGNDILSDIVAYPLTPEGGLPALPTTMARTPEAFFYLGFAVADSFGFAADPSRTGYDRFPIADDGNLPDPVPTPTLPGAITPEPSPIPDPSPVPTQSPAFFFLDDVGPTRTIKVFFDQPSPMTPLLYTAAQGGPRIAALPVTDGNLPTEPSSLSPTRGIYNELLYEQSVGRIYGAGFQIGQVDSFSVDSSGNIDRDSLSATFANTAQFPTGLAWVAHATSSGQFRRTLLVSLGGFNRVDAYEVFDDGTLAERPFSSTEPRDGTFPADVLAHVVTSD